MLPPYPAKKETAASGAASASERLIVFTRYPEPGQTKTRLIPALGPERAAQLHEILTRRTIRSAEELCQSTRCDLEVRYTGGAGDAMARKYGVSPRYMVQQGSNFGEKLWGCIEAAFTQGCNRVVVIGTDCPELETARLVEAFTTLEHADIVLGPAHDGGYYLIGLSQPRPELFQSIAWGTAHVLRQTLEAAQNSNCSVRLLDPLGDIDHPEDLLICRRYPSDFAAVLPCAEPGLLSIIIPALNEERSIAATLRPLVGRENVEVIVADGGSTDATVEVSQELGAAVVGARRGRGRQLNAGAALTQGETLLFLHADSQVPPNFETTIAAVLNSGCVAGAFRLHIDSSRRMLRWVERGANLRSRLLQLPYGDQGLFLRAELFYQLGGYPDWPLLEDYELSRRLRRKGRIALAAESVSTSARRWNKLGVCRTTLINQCTLLGYHLGVSPERLARWYTDWTKRESS